MQEMLVQKLEPFRLTVVKDAGAPAAAAPVATAAPLAPPPPTPAPQSLGEVAARLCGFLTRAGVADASFVTKLDSPAAVASTLFPLLQRAESGVCSAEDILQQLLAELDFKPAAEGVGTSANAPKAQSAALGPRAVHHGVICDGCGQDPIMGPRFKSVTKPDFDLCEACEGKNDPQWNDLYARMDEPAKRCGMRPFFGAFRPGGPMRGRCGPWTAGGRARGVPGGKLDARFVRDVTVFDGSQVEAGATLTKIWRVRNTGSAPWPPSSRLIRVGGDQIGCSNVAVPMPAAGLAPGEETEVSVDIVAPQLPGRYVSYYRLMGGAAPYDVRYGQRLWLLIQVLPPKAPSADGGSSSAPASECVVGESTGPAHTDGGPDACAEANTIQAAAERVLAEMGFANDALNRVVLSSHAGDVEAAVLALASFEKEDSGDDQDAEWEEVDNEDSAAAANDSANKTAG